MTTHVTTLVSAELFKLRTTRTPWLLTVALAAAAVAVLAFNAALLGRAGQPALEPSVIGDLARAPGWLTGAVALLLGLLLSTAEYRHNTVLTTRLGYPRVPGLVLGKAVAAMLAGLALAVAVEIVMVGGTAAMLAYRGVAVEPWRHGVPAAVVATALVSALYAVAGVGIGELLRGPALALGAVFGTFMLQGVLPVLFHEPELDRWLPNGATASALALGADTDGTLPVPWMGLLLLAAYAAGLLLAGLGRAAVTDP
ncbi:MAG TPA: hypothetical protein VFT95_02875 [Micromonosporaceae bacterium]|nr:hypothetical protein [Micromonosporaceae bacterium]